MACAESSSCGAAPVCSACEDSDSEGELESFRRLVETGWDDDGGLPLHDDAKREGRRHSEYSPPPAAVSSAFASEAVLTRVLSFLGPAIDPVVTRSFFDAFTTVQRTRATQALARAVPLEMAALVERELFAGCNAKLYPPGIYQRRLRAFCFNLCDNAELREQLLHGALTAAAFVRLRDQDMLRKNLAELDNAARAAAVRARTKLPPTGNVSGRFRCSLCGWTHQWLRYIMRAGTVDVSKVSEVMICVQCRSTGPYTLLADSADGAESSSRAPVSDAGVAAAASTSSALAPASSTSASSSVAVASSSSTASTTSVGIRSPEKAVVSDALPSVEAPSVGASTSVSSLSRSGGSVNAAPLDANLREPLLHKASLSDSSHLGLPAAAAVAATALSPSHVPLEHSSESAGRAESASERGSNAQSELAAAPGLNSARAAEPAATRYAHGASTASSVAFAILHRRIMGQLDAMAASARAALRARRLAVRSDDEGGGDGGSSISSSDDEELEDAVFNLSSSAGHGHVSAHVSGHAAAALRMTALRRSATSIAWPAGRDAPEATGSAGSAELFPPRISPSRLRSAAAADGAAASSTSFAGAEYHASSHHEHHDRPEASSVHAATHRASEAAVGSKRGRRTFESHPVDERNGASSACGAAVAATTSAGSLGVDEQPSATSMPLAEHKSSTGMPPMRAGFGSAHGDADETGELDRDASSASSAAKRSRTVRRDHHYGAASASHHAADEPA